MEKQLLEYIEANHQKNKGVVGLTPIELMQKFNIDYATLKPVLNNLFKKKQITIRKGLNHKLVFYAQQN